MLEYPGNISHTLERNICYTHTRHSIFIDIDKEAGSDRQRDGIEMTDGVFLLTNKHQ